jgi:hypothetical protein
METNIKSAVATAVLATLSALAMASSAQAASKSCSNATLSGNYGATITGTVSGSPLAELDLVSANGKGSFSGTGTLSFNGSISTVTISATYTINPNCSGSATFTDGTTQNFVITTDGTEVMFIGTNNPSAQVTGHAKNLGSDPAAAEAAEAANNANEAGCALNNFTSEIYGPGTVPNPYTPPAGFTCAL